MVSLRQRTSAVLDRALRPLSKVHPGEGALAAVMLLCVFLILSSYYLMKTAREGLILSGGTFGLRGDELKTYATGVMAVLLFGLVPAYGWLANRVRRIVLINASYAAVIVSLLGFFALGRIGVPIGLPFFVWLGVVSLFLVAQFWSYANDIYTEEQGKRLFAIIAIGGSLGAVLGPRVAHWTDTFLLLPLAAVLLAACLALLNQIDRHLAHRQRSLVAAPIVGPGAFRLVLRDRYLLLIGVMLLVLNLVNTTGEYLLSHAVREHAMALSDDPAERREIIKAFYADFFFWVNLIGFLVQAFLVSRIIGRLGVRIALFIMPVIVFGAYTAIAAAGTLAVIRAAKIADNATDYSLQNTVRQTLFLPTTRAVKYKAKAAIDTFFVRTGDLLSALMIGLFIHQLGLHGRELALVNVALVGVWLAICLGIARRYRAIAVAAALGLASPVAAQPLRDEPTAASVRGAPRPGEESGRSDPGEHDSAARRIARGVLFVPRAVFDTVFWPVRRSVHEYEEHHVAEHARRFFFNDAETVGAYPIATFESDFGVTGGARFVAGLGLREQLRVQAAAGGRYRARVAGSVRAFRVDDRVMLELRAEYDRRPAERFAGLGDVDGAVETRFRQDLARGALDVDARLAADLHLRLAGAATDLEPTASTTGPLITDVYPMATMTGFGGYRHLYAEAELAWDTRRRARRWESRSLYAAGWLASAYAGRVAMEGGADFWRYGGDVQRFLRLGRGPRVLALRLHGEAVSGTYADVPFTELPALGGSTVLRGYATERFRDRVAAFGSAEYEWDLARTLFASLFVDAGRVFPAVDDIRVDDLRYGYGFALELHGGKAFWLRGSVASNTDGGVFVNVSFSPVFDVDPRTVRR